MDRPRPELKYLPVDELDRSKMRLGNFTVEDPAGETLGTLEGFIIDLNTARPYYLVVKARAWFRAKHVLIPIGHAALDAGSRRVVADVPGARVKRFPGFDLDSFSKLTPEDFDRMAQEIARVCCPDHVIVPTQLLSVLENWAHYRTPAWWNHEPRAKARPSASGEHQFAERHDVKRPVGR